MSGTSLLCMSILAWKIILYSSGSLQDKLWLKAGNITILFRPLQASKCQHHTSNSKLSAEIFTSFNWLSKKSRNIQVSECSLERCWRLGSAWARGWIKSSLWTPLSFQYSKGYAYFQACIPVVQKRIGTEIEFRQSGYNL